MNNNLIITKLGFYDDSQVLLSNIPIDFCALSEQYVENGRKTIELLTGSATRIFYQIDFPERFYPSIASQFFWTKIKEYMKQGIMFEIKTSDLISCGWINRTFIDGGGMTNIGWDNVMIRRPDVEDEEHFQNHYGSDLNSLMSSIQF